LRSSYNKSDRSPVCSTSNIVLRFPAPDDFYSSYPSNRVTAASLQTKPGKIHNINSDQSVATLSKFLGRYEIESEVGRGAMGVVFRARDPKIDRSVAIKTISILEQDSDEERDFRERFVLEAKAAGGLSHPGIVTIFDVGEEPESRVPYIVMEYVEGRPLSRILGSSASRKLPLGPALQLAQEIAEALHYAHGRGVVHRDIKPANILVTREGHAKIADFGIAKVSESQITLPGRVLGSPAYMAPEQLSGEPADARSDLFSLGVILYTILTGHRPFQGNSAATVISKVAHHDPLPVTVLEADFPAALNRIISRAIAKDPAQRYQTGAEMAAEIQKLRANRKLLNETAGSLAVVSKSSAVVMPSVLAGSPLGALRKAAKAGIPAGFKVRPIAGENAPGTPAAVRPTKIAFAVAALMVVATAIALHYRGDEKSGQAAAASGTTVAPAARSGTNGGLENLSPVRPQPARMEIEIEHHFVIARASVWLDNNLVYQKELQGSTQKHALVLQRTLGFDASTVKLPAGPHEVKVRVQSGIDAYDLSKTISGTLVSGRQSVLRVTCDRQPNLLQVVLR
jgi:serine/threonine protein kinase